MVVRDNRIVARGHNEANSRQDVTAHAETVVMRKLSKKFGAVSIDRAANRERLGSCTLYTTVEPCPMCAWALWEYRIERLFELTGQAVAVESGVLAEECAALRR